MITFWHRDQPGGPVRILSYLICRQCRISFNGDTHVQKNLWGQGSATGPWPASADELNTASLPMTMHITDVRPPACARCWPSPCPSAATSCPARWAEADPDRFRDYLDTTPAQILDQLGIAERTCSTCDPAQRREQDGRASGTSARCRCGMRSSSGGAVRDRGGQEMAVANEGRVVRLVALACPQ